MLLIHVLWQVCREDESLQMFPAVSAGSSNIRTENKKIRETTLSSDGRPGEGTDGSPSTEGHVTFDGPCIKTGLTSLVLNDAFPAGNFPCETCCSAWQGCRHQGWDASEQGHRGAFRGTLQTPDSHCFQQFS